MFMVFRKMPLDDGPDRVKDIFAWQIITRRDHGLSRRLLIVSAMNRSLAAHVVVTAES